MLERFFELFNTCLSRFKFFLRDEPRDGIQVVSVALDAESRGFYERRTTPDKRVENLLLTNAHIFRIEFPQLSGSAISTFSMRFSISL
nr:hypothetical protein [Halorubrum saccharovorum]